MTGAGAPRCFGVKGMRASVSKRHFTMAKGENVLKEPTHPNFGKLGPSTWGEDVAWKGPSVEPKQKSQNDYTGNISTPSWLLGEEEGPAIAQKCKELFKGYEPTVKKSVGNFKMRLVPGRATAGPPIGPTFSQQGVKSIDFVKAFNDATAGIFTPDPELRLKVYIRFYEDKTYQWRMLPPTTSWLLRKAADLPPCGPLAFGAGKGIGNTQRYEGFLTLEQLYHVAALVNTWDVHSDYVPLELRVYNLIGSAFQQGIAVLGVHTRPGPILGMTDAQQYEHIHKMKEEWIKNRLVSMDDQPLQRVPWMTRMYDKNTKGFDLPHQRDPDAKVIVKDALAVDKLYQKMLDDEDAGPKKTTRLDWENWKQTGVLARQKDGFTGIEARQVAQAKAERTAYLVRRYPSILQRHRNYRAMWWSNEWEGVQQDTDLHQRVR